MDATELLTKDHNKVRELFRRYNGGGGLTGLVKRTAGLVEPKVQRDVLARICEELETHTRIEEQRFYPAVRALKDEELDGQVDEAMKEHAGVKEQVRQLRARTEQAENLTTEVGQLEHDVEHHAGEEEREMFPRVKELMPSSERALLGKQMAALKRGAPATAAAGGRAKRVISDPKKRTTAKKTGTRSRTAKTASRPRTRASKRTTTRSRAKSVTARTRNKRKAARKKR